MNTEVETKLPVRYGRWQITYSDAFCPFPVQFVHDDFDGPGDRRAGYAKSLEDAVDQIDEIDPMHVPLRIGQRVKYKGSQPGWGPFIARLVAVGQSGEHGTFQTVSGRFRYATLADFERHIGYGDEY